jgi:hypothetical protein
MLALPSVRKTIATGLAKVATVLPARFVGDGEGEGDGEGDGEGEGVTVGVGLGVGVGLPESHPASASAATSANDAAAKWRRRPDVRLSGLAPDWISTCRMNLDLPRPILGGMLVSGWTV